MATYTLPQEYHQEPGGAYVSDLADNSHWGRAVPLEGLVAQYAQVRRLGAHPRPELRLRIHGRASTVEVLDANGVVTGTEDIRLKVKPYYTFDWQSMWNINKSFGLTVGLLNMFDKKPPLVVDHHGWPAGRLRRQSVRPAWSHVLRATCRSSSDLTAAK